MSKQIPSLTALMILAMALAAFAGDPVSGRPVTEKDYLPGRIVVKLSESADVQTESTVRALLGDVLAASVTEARRVFPDYTRRGPAFGGYGLDRIFVLRFPADLDIQGLLSQLKVATEIEYAEPDYIYRILTYPNDEHYDPEQYYLSNYGQDFYDGVQGTPDADVDAPEAWDIEQGSGDITIGIIDTGVDYTHPDLDAKVIQGYDFVNDDNDPMDNDATGNRGHGTRCAGIAAAETDNHVGIAGICPECMIMPLKGCDLAGGCASSWVNPAIIYAIDNGADVISMSFGSLSPSFLMQDVLDAAEASGVILVAAVGNDGSPDERYPAAYPEVLAVGATDYDDELYIDSNYGPWVDVAAPGVLMFSTEMVSRGSYGYRTGTSFAAPLVAGEAGLMLSRYAGLSKAEVETIIRDNVEPYHSPVYIGTGRINAHYAVRSVCDDGTICPGGYECLAGGTCKLPCDSVADCNDLGPTYGCIDGYCEDLSGVPHAPRVTGQISMLPNTPDPFSYMTEVQVALNRPARVSLSVYDVSGRLVRVLADRVLSEGIHAVSWDGTTSDGMMVAAGIYFCRLEAAGIALTQKMTLTH